MKCKVKQRFRIGFDTYEPGDTVDVNQEKAKELSAQGLIAGKKEPTQSTIPKGQRDKQQKGK